MPQPERPLHQAIRPQHASHGSGFDALRLSADMFGPEGSPWFTIDHFRMQSPTFPPHPHAGFSAVTYVLPRSENGMRNRDSRGDRSVIAPGGLHWTAAGSGIVHEEVPDVPDSTCEGFQIFVRQPVAQETTPAVIQHANPDEIPTVALPGGGEARLLAGSFAGATSPVTPPSPLMMLDITMAAGSTLQWPSQAGWSLALYLYDGALNIQTRTHSAPALLTFERASGDASFACAEGAARFLVMSGEPVDAPAYSNGPFVLSSPAAISDAVSRFHAGAMGQLTADW